MKISQINNVNCSSKSNNLHGQNVKILAPQNQVGFRGLFGYSSSSGDEFNAIFTDYYYPFLDESKEEIDKVVKDGTYSSTISWDTPGTNTFMVEVQETLPIKKAEWSKYQKNIKDLSYKTRVFIEETLKRFDLKQHIKK